MGTKFYAAWLLCLIRHSFYLRMQMVLGHCNNGTAGVHGGCTARQHLILQRTAAESRVAHHQHYGRLSLSDRRVR